MRKMYWKDLERFPVEPVGFVVPLPWRDHDCIDDAAWSPADGEEGRAARRKAIRNAIPYRPGDVVLAATSRGVRRCRVVRAFLEYRERRLMYVARYRVQVETAKGKWSRNWQLVYEGYVQRGYENARAEVEAELRSAAQ